MDNEKKKRLEKQLKAWKASPQFKEFLEALQQYSIHFSKILSDAEIEYKEAAAFYQEWIGKKAIPQREFFEWFFQEKHDTTLAELVKHSPEVRVMDIEEAAKWFVAEYRKNKQPQQLQEPQKPAPQAFGSYADGQIFSHHNCTSKEFRQDITELCLDCPLPEKIKQALQIQILAAAQDMKEVLPAAGFKEYLGAEINDAAKAMQKMRLQAQAPGAVLNKVTEIFIWNKERIKALKGFSDNKEPQKPAPQAFGPELVEVVRNALTLYALEEDSLLDTEGYYIGKKNKAKPLFDALKGQGFFKKKHSPTKQTMDFEKLLKKEFDFHVSYKTIGKEVRTKHQQRDFEEFSRIIGEILEK